MPEGQIVSVIGRSGSGKSTLLRVLMTLECPDAGRVEIAGQSAFSEMYRGQERPASEAHMRRVRSRFNLFPHMTALHNVMEAPVHVLGIRLA